MQGFDSTTKTERAHTVDNPRGNSRELKSCNLNPSTPTDPQIITGYLQQLCNKYGDFKVARAWRGNDGELHWSKHRSVMECWESQQGIAWLGTVNNRQILKNEIIIDLDENPTEEKMNWICDLLEGLGEHYRAYHTGSRGYHIHITSNTFALLSETERKNIRNRLLKIIARGADQQKNSEKVMIALEGAPHWKTGQPKKMVRQYPKWDD